MATTYYSGVSFFKGKIQLAEIERKRKKLKVTTLVERETSLDLIEAGPTLSADHPQVQKFSRELKELVKQNNIKTQYISFALPPDPVFINIIPIDPSLSAKELKKYLSWEVEQYFPNESVNTFITDSHILMDDKTRIPQTFMVAVRRGIVAFLQKVASSLQMNLHIIDIDQFSTEKTLITNYPEILVHDIVLFGIRNRGVDASLIHNGEMVDYRCFPNNGEANPDKHILTYLKYLKQKNCRTPEALLLYGENVDKSLIVALRTETGIKQTVSLNVFRKLKGDKHLNPLLVRESYRFAAAIGLALREK